MEKEPLQETAWEEERACKDSGDIALKIEGLQKKVQELKTDMGDAFYKAYSLAGSPDIKIMGAMCQEIAAAEKEIVSLETRLAEEKKKVFCTACGKELAEESRFCNLCGGKAGIRGDKVEVEDTPKPPSPPQKRAKKVRSRGGKVIYFLKVIILLLLLAAVINIANNFLYSLRYY